MNFETTQELKKEITALVVSGTLDEVSKAILEADIWHYNYSVSKDGLNAIRTGFIDASCGIYDKWWRYETTREEFYNIGSQVALAQGSVIDRFLG